MQAGVTLYLTIFVLFFRFAERAWSREANAAKGAAGVTIVVSVLVMAAAFWISRLVGYSHLSKLTFFVVWFALYLFNYWLLVVKERGTTFERQFREFDRRRRLLLLTGGGTIVVGAIVLLLIAPSE